MLNRRLIRIKVFKILYSSVSCGADSLQKAEKELLFSCEKTLHLYYFILNLSIALANTARAKIELGLKKFHPSPEESHPNRKFADNLFSQRMMEDKSFNDFCEKNALMWNGDFNIFVRKLFAHISQQEYFINYMNSNESSLEEDCKLFKNIYEEEFEDNDDLESILEDSSIYWMDDLNFVLNVILRNIDNLISNGRMITPSVFMKKDDEEFAVKLLDASLSNYAHYMDIISSNVSNWDSDRLVATDLILIEQGVAEAVKFHNIPVKVTINEYVEISKFYSTPNSKVFVNGLLDTIIQKMVSTGEIVKTGRGLIDS